MSELSEIQKLVADDLKAVEQLFHRGIKSKVPLLDTITRYLVRKKGKQMRPLFVLLSAGMHGEISPAAHRASALIEMLHTATLIHDDVVDEAWQRRGLLSINAVWRNKIAVLVGDFILSRGLLQALEHKEYEQLHIVSEATRQMSEGELLQIEKARRLDIDETVYYEIIRKKLPHLSLPVVQPEPLLPGRHQILLKRCASSAKRWALLFRLKTTCSNTPAGTTPENVQGQT